MTNESEYPAVKINNYGISNAFEVFDDERVGLIVAKGGFVGINNYAPEYDLEVYGDTHVTSLFKTSNLLVYGDDTTILTRQTNMNSVQMTNESEYPAVKINNYGISNAFEVFDDERVGLIVAKGGFVGINNYAPEYDLEVYGDTHVTSLFKSSNLLVYGDDTTILTRQTNMNSVQMTNESEYPAVKINNYGISNAFEVFDDERVGLIVAKGGFVGINNYAPEYDLEVYGDTHVTSLFKTSNLLVYGDDTTILTRQTNENIVTIISDKEDTAFSIYNNGYGDAVHIENPYGYNFTITNQGYIGINRTDPDYEVDIVGNLKVSETLYTSNIIIYGDTTTINTTTYQSEKMEIVSQTQGPALTIKQYDAHDMLHVYDDDDIVFTINNTRKIGVNKKDPEYDLDVNGEIHTNTWIRTHNIEVYGEEAIIDTRTIHNNFVQIINQSEYPTVKIENTGTSNAFEVFDDGVEALVITKGGTVGINIYEPDSQYRLDVNGTVHINDQLKTYNLEIYGDEAVINSKVYVYNNLLIAQDTEYPAARIENTGTSNAFEVYDDDRACLIITKGGYIGINTDAPQYDLEIIGQAHIDTLMKAYSVEVYGSELKILTPSISSNYVDITNDTNTPAFKINNYGIANALEVYDDEILSLIVTKGGNIGINTDNPGYKLEVIGNANFNDQLMTKELLVYGDEAKFLTRFIQSNYVNVINDTEMPSFTIANYGSSNAFEIYNGEDINLIVTNSGLIGINTFEPSYEFDVNGTINATFLQGDGQYLYNVNFEDRSTDLLREGSNLYYTSYRVGVIAAASNVHTSNYVLMKTNALDSDFSNAINVTINDRINYILGLATSDSTSLNNTIQSVQTNIETNTSNLYLTTIIDDIAYNSEDTSNYTTNVYNILTNEIDVLTNFVDNISLQTGTGNIIANYEFAPVIRYDFDSTTSNATQIVDIGDGGTVRFNSLIYNSSNVSTNNSLSSVQGFAGKAFLWKYVENTNVSPYIYNTNTANLRLLMNAFHMCNGFTIHFVIKKTIQSTINQIFMIVNGASYSNTLIKVTVEDGFLIFYVGNTYYTACQIDDDVWYNIDCICKIAQDYSTMSLFIYINGDYSKSTNTINVPYNNDLLNPSLTNLVLLIGYNLNNTFYDNNNAELYLENLQLFSKAVTLEEMDGLLYNFDTWKISSGFAPISSNVYYPYGNVGIGTNNPKDELHIAGNATIEIGDIFKKTQVYIPESISPDVWYRFTENPTSVSKVNDYGYSNLVLTINNGDTTTKSIGYTGNSYVYQSAYTWNSANFYLSNADTSNIVTLVDKFNINGFTIHFVMKTSTSNKEYPIFFIGKNEDNIIYIKIGADNRLYFISNDVQLTSGLLSANTWYVVDVLFEIYGAVASITININGSTTNTIFDFISKFDIYKVVKDNGIQTWVTSIGAYDNRFDNLGIDGIQYYIGKHPIETINAIGLTLQDFRIYNEPLIMTEINKLFYGRADVSKIKTTVTEPYGVERWLSSGYYDTSGKYITYTEGNVGIGTNEPIAGLHILSENDYMCLLVDNFGTSNSLEVFDDNNASFIVAKGGNVGIGLYTPTQALQIQRPYVDNYMKIDSGLNYSGIMLTQFNVNLGYSIRYDVTTDKLLFSTQNNSLTYTNLMALTNTGNLGIGSTTPQYTMDVYGSTGFDGSTILRLYNPASQFGKTQMIMVGRLEGANDTWNLTSGRNSIVFGSQTVKDGAISYTNAIQAYDGNIGLFSSSYSTSAPALTVTSTGNVGIGITNPSLKLQVLGSGNNTSLNASLTTYSSYMGFRNTADTKTAYVGLDGVGLSDIERGALLMGTWTANSIIMSTNTTEKLRITSNGNVGIGNTNPIINLSVGSTNANHKMGRAIINANNQHNADKVDAFSIGRWDGTSATNLFCGMRAEVGLGSQTGEANNNHSFVSFYTWGNGIAGSREVMRINQRGNVGIGTTDPSTHKLNVNGSLSVNGGCALTVQNNQDGGTDRGIYMWNSTDTNWGIYMGSSGTTKSLSRGIAVSGAGFTSYAIRNRVNNLSTAGFIWENSAESCLASLRGSDGLMYIAGNTGIGNSTNIVSKLTINDIVVDRGTFDHSEAPLTITHQSETSATVLNDPKTVLHLCRQGTTSQSYGAKASFKLCRWENASNFFSRTRLDFTLSHNQYDDINIISVRSDGNVGIGTTSPTDELHLHKSALIQNVGIRFTDGTTAATTTDGCLIEKNSSSQFRLWNFESADMFFGTANSERMRIMSTGNIGIGTNNAVDELHIHSSSTAQNIALRLTDGTSGATNSDGFLIQKNSTSQAMIWNYETADMFFGTANSERMRIMSTGNIGIGITNPTEKLDVSGNIKVSGNINSVTSTELAYLSGVTSSIQTQINNSNVYTSNYVVGTSNIISNRITALTADNIANGSTNKFIINNVYNNDMTVNGTLTATNLNVNGTTTTINTTTYQTENMEIVTSAIDGPALKIVQNGTQNLMDVIDATVNVFCIKDGGNVGIANTNPAEKLDVTGNIKFSGNINNITSTELQYLSGVTSAIQTQIGSKEPTISLGSTQYALINTTAGKVGVSSVTSIELGYLSGVSSAIQTQIGSKEPTISLGSTQYALINTTAGKVGVSSVTSIELGYLSGVSSAIQTQINSKQDTLTAGTGITISNNTISSVPTQWTTNNTNIYYSSGNVGIGTNSPVTALHVSSGLATAALSIPLKISAKAYPLSGYTTPTLIGLGTEDSTYSKCALGHLRTTGWDVGDIVFLLNSTQDNSTVSMSNEKMRITSTGSVGIGTNAPLEELHMHNSTLAQQVALQLTDGTTTATASRGIVLAKTTNQDLSIINYQSGKDVIISTSPTTTGTITERVRLLANGNLGIGVTNAGYKLDVSGDVNITGTYRVNGNAFTTSQWTTTGNNIYYTTGNVGVGTSTVSSKVTINPEVTQNNAYSHSEAPLTITNTTVTSTTVLNDAKSVLHLCRDGTSTQCYGTKASFKLCRYEAPTTPNNLHSRSRLDITLAYSTYEDTNVMSIRSDGCVGIGTTAPLEELHIHNSTTARQIGIQLTDGSTTSAASRGAIIAKTTNQDLSIINYQSAKDIIFSTSPTTTGTIIERLRIFANGNVGIGTNAPLEELHMHNTTTAQQVALQLTDGTTTAAASRGIVLAKTTNQDLSIINYQSGKDVIISTSPTTTGTITERVRLLANGNLGLGITNPQYKIDVSGDVNITGTFRVNGTAFTSSSSQWTTSSTNIYYTTGSVGIGTNSPQTTLDVRGKIYIKPSTVAAPSVGTYGGSGDRIILYEGTASAMPYSLGIDASTLWYVVPTSASYKWYTNTANTMTLDTNGNLNVAGDITAYFSDIRLKTNLIPLSNFDETLSSLTGYTFNWNEKGQEILQKQSDDVEVGLIAQHVQKVIPQAVAVNKASTDTENNYLTIKYEKIIPYLIEGYKHQKTIIEEQKQEIQDLKSRLEKLEKLLFM